MIQAGRATSHATVIAVTAYPQSEEQMLERGAEACLARRVDMDLLVSRVRAAAETARP